MIQITPKRKKRLRFFCALQCSYWWIYTCYNSSSLQNFSCNWHDSINRFHRVKFFWRLFRISVTLNTPESLCRVWCLSYRRKARWCFNSSISSLGPNICHVVQGWSNLGNLEVRKRCLGPWEHPFYNSKT